MAAEDDKKLISNLEKVSASLANAAKKLDSASEELSNKGVDKLTKSIKDFLKTNGQLTDAQASMIKDMRTLSAHLDDMEDDFIKLSKAEVKLIKEMDDLRKANIAGVDQIEEQQRRELGLSKDYVNQKRAELEATKAFIEAQVRNAKSTDGMSKAIEKHTASIKAQVAKWTSIGTGLTMVAEAAKQAYNDMNTYSQKGLLGGFSTMATVSKKLLMTGMEFSEIINKNRDLINTMGGGNKGIREFAQAVSEARVGLEYMGKEGSKAAARFVEMNKNLGLTKKDGAAYQKALNDTKNQFKKFSGLFGDSYEEFAQLIETQEQEENNRRRLNNMSKQQLAQARQELLIRTDNMKMMGLSNQQIMEFNKRTEEMNNPRKSGQIGTRMQEGQMAKNLVAMLQNSGTTEGAALGGHKDALNEYFNMRQQGDAAGMKKFEGSERGMEALKALSKARSSIDKLDQYKREGINRVDEMAGLSASHAISVGDAGNTAQQQEKNLLGKPKTEREAIVKEASDMQKGLDPIFGDLGDKMAKLSTIVETVKSILNDPFTKAAVGAAVVIAGLAMAARSASVALKSLGGGGLGGVDGPDGKSGKGGKGGSVSKGGKLLSGAGKVLKGAGIVGSIVDAGAGVADLANGKAQTEMEGLDWISPMRWGMRAGDEVNKQFQSATGDSIGGKAYDWFHKDSITASNATVAPKPRGAAGAPSGPASSQTPTMLKPAQAGSVAERRAALESQMTAAGITDPKERAAFLAQMDHESGGFKFMTELGKNAGQQYEGRKDLGNMKEGDGQRYKGRGFIQLTGRANYDKYGKMIGQDLINNPELAADPTIAAQIATAYWKDRGLGTKLKKDGFDAVTKGINGGFNGKADRDKKFAMYQQQGTQVGSPSFTGGPTAALTPPSASSMADGATAAPLQVSVNDPNSKSMVAVLERIESNTRNNNKASVYQQPPGVVAQHVG